MEQIELVGEEFWVGEFTLEPAIVWPDWGVHWVDDDGKKQEARAFNLFINAPLYATAGVLTGTGKVIQMGDTVYITDISTNANRQFDGKNVASLRSRVPGEIHLPDRTPGEITSSVLRDSDAPVTGTTPQTPTGSGHSGIPCAE